MAGAAGRVANRSPFASFVINNWQPWMTMAVIEHASGVDIPTLRVRYGKTDHYIRNVMNTVQAKEIIVKMNSRALAAIHDSTLDRMKAANAKALDRVTQFLNDDDLAEKAPATVWQLSLKTMDTLREPTTPLQNTFNQQNNYFLPPDVLAKLKSEAQIPAVPQLELASKNYESPPAPLRRATESVLGSGICQPSYKIEDGPSIPLQLRTGSED